jgi:hypothetical protein
MSNIVGNYFRLAPLTESRALWTTTHIRIGWFR